MRRCNGCSIHTVYLKLIGVFFHMNEKKIEIKIHRACVCVDVNELAMLKHVCECCCCCCCVAAAAVDVVVADAAALLHTLLDQFQY